MVQPEQPKERKRWRGWRWVGWTALGMLGLLLVAYFVLTSNTFFKGFILPRVGEAMNATLTVSEVSIRPFQEVVLRNLKMQLPEYGASASAKEVFARCSLLGLLGSRVVVKEITLEAPTVRITWPPDATNAPGVLAPASRARPPRGAPSPRAKRWALDLAKLTLANGTFSFLRTDTNGHRIVVELTDLNLGLNNVKNGQTARLTVGSGLKFNSGQADSMSKLSATLKGEVNLALDQALQPEWAKGEATAAIVKASGAFTNAAQVEAKIGVDLTLTEIKKVALHFTRNTSTLGMISLSGPFQVQQQEGRIHAEVTGIGREVLSLVGGPYGLDFGNAQLAANLDIALASRGEKVTSSGEVTANQFSLIRTPLTNVATPVINLELTYDASVDRPRQNATVRQLTLRATQDERPFVASTLSRPMVLDWSPGGQTVDEAWFSLALTNLNLAQWRAFVGSQIHTGELSAGLTAQIQRGGQQIGLELNGQLLGLGAQWAGLTLDQADADLLARGTVSNFTLVNLAVLNVAVQHQTEAVLSLAASGRYQRDTQDATLQIEMVAGVPQVARMLRWPDATLTSGSATFRTYLTQTNHAAATLRPAQLSQTLFAQLQVDKLTGQLGAHQLDRLAGKLHLDAAHATPILDLRQLQLSLPPTERATNQIQLTGQLDLSRTNALSGKLKLTADAVDATPYYNMFVAPPPATESPAPTDAPRSQRSPPDSAPVIPPATKIPPVHDLVLDTRVNRFHLGEVAISNFLSTLRLQGGNVSLDPVEFSLNGGPVTASSSVSLSTTGSPYRFDLDAHAVPLTPLFNTFHPACRDQVGGTLDATVTLADTGPPGTNRFKNLTGAVDWGTTNLNLALGDLQVPVLKEVVNVIRHLPDLMRRVPGGWDQVLEWMANAREDTDPAWLEELANSPVDAILGRAQIRGDRVDVEQVRLQTPAFQADLRGTLQLLPVLTNSPIDLPVIVRLPRSLAEPFNLLPATTPTNATHVSLPEFFRMGGTVGQPKPGPVGASRLELNSPAAPSLSPAAAPILDRGRDAIEGGRATTNTATTNAPGIRQTTTNPTPRLNR